MTKDLQAWSYDNWKKIPDLVRQDCINMLQDNVSAKLLATWKMQVKAGLPIGSDDRYFHFGVGMGLRNLLRKQQLDQELPLVKQSDSSMSQNWDDYYIGALQEWAEQELAKG